MNKSFGHTDEFYAEALRQTESEAITTVSKKLFSQGKNISIAFDASIYAYVDIPPYEEALAQYRQEIAKVLSRTLVPITQTALSLLENMQYENPRQIISFGFMSISSDFMERREGEIKAAFLSEITKEKSAIDKASNALSKEFLIWRANAQNLKSVGITKNYPLPRVPSIEEIAEYALTSYFVALMSEEQKIRTRTLSQDSNPYYVVYWENK